LLYGLKGSLEVHAREQESEDLLNPYTL